MSQYISTSTLTNLFHTTVGYHRRRLREIFRANFNPSENHVWTKDLPQRVLNELHHGISELERLIGVERPLEQGLYTDLES